MCSKARFISNGRRRLLWSLAYTSQMGQRTKALTWYGTTQNPHPQRFVLAKALRLPEHSIRVIAPPAGGAFGLKMHGHPEETLVAVLSRQFGRP